MEKDRIQQRRETGHAGEPEEERQEGDEKRQPQQRKRENSSFSAGMENGSYERSRGEVSERRRME